MPVERAAQPALLGQAWTTELEVGSEGVAAFLPPPSETSLEALTALMSRRGELASGALEGGRLFERIAAAIFGA